MPLFSGTGGMMKFAFLSLIKCRHPIIFGYIVYRPCVYEMAMRTVCSRLKTRSKKKRFSRRRDSVSTRNRTVLSSVIADVASEFGPALHRGTIRKSCRARVAGSPTKRGWAANFITSGIPSRNPRRALLTWKKREEGGKKRDRKARYFLVRNGSPCHIDIDLPGRNVAEKAEN